MMGFPRFLKEYVLQSRLRLTQKERQVAGNTSDTPGQAASSLITVAESDSRAKIGRQVTYFALTVTGVLGTIAILVAIFVSQDLEKRFAYVKDILTILLPVLGTWVGTILAFYFSKENFAAAAQQTSDLVKQLTPDEKLQSVSAVDVMIPMKGEKTTKLILDKPDDQINLKTNIIDALFEKFARNRLPVVDPTDKIIYIIHRSFVDKFVASKLLAEPGAAASLTLKDLLADEEMKKVFVAFGVVGKNAKLITVKEKMAGNPDCSDVFITEDGTANTSALGWITNVILEENSKV